MKMFTVGAPSSWLRSREFPQSRREGREGREERGRTEEGCCVRGGGGVSTMKAASAGSFPLQTPNAARSPPCPPHQPLHSPCPGHAPTHDATAQRRSVAVRTGEELRGTLAYSPPTTRTPPQPLPWSPLSMMQQYSASPSLRNGGVP